MAKYGQITFDMDKMPPSDGSEEGERGRRYATFACVECHTPLSEDVPKFPGTQDDYFSSLTVMDDERLFHGRPSPDEFFLRVLPFQDERFLMPNITQHETGILGWTEDDVVTLLKEGIRPDGSLPCPPFRGGRTPGYGSLTEEDARAIARYIVSLPGANAPNTLAPCGLRE